MQPFSEHQHPDLPTPLMKMSVVLRLPRELHLCRSSSNVPRLLSFLEALQNPHVWLTFHKVRNPWRLPRATALSSKSGPRRSVFSTFDFWLHATAACTFSTSQPPPKVWCFLVFWLQNMLLATVACTFSTSQPPKVVRTCGVFLVFWLQNMLLATVACIFSTSQLPKVHREWNALVILTSKCASRHNGVHTFWTSQLLKVLREWCVLYVLTSTCASRHSGVHCFDISTSTSGPNLRCFQNVHFQTRFAPHRRAIFDFPYHQMAHLPL